MTYAKFFSGVTIVPIDDLKEHEEVDPDHLQSIKQEIESARAVKLAVIADVNTNVVLDGEHRLTALRELGCSRVPVVFVKYLSHKILVDSWVVGGRLTKGAVIAAGLSGRRLPSKTSRHQISVDGRYEHISVLGRMMEVPLGELK